MTAIEELREMIRENKVIKGGGYTDEWMEAMRKYRLKQLRKKKLDRINGKG